MSIPYRMGKQAALIKLGYREPGMHEFFDYDALEDAEMQQSGDRNVGYLKSMGLGGLGGGALGYGAGALLGNKGKGALIGGALGAVGGGVAKNIKNRGVYDQLGPAVAPFDEQLQGIRGRRKEELKPHHAKLDEVDEALYDVDNVDDLTDYVDAQRPSHVRPYMRDLWLKDQGIQAEMEPIHKKYDEEEKPVGAARQQAYAPHGKKLRQAF